MKKLLILSLLVSSNLAAQIGGSSAFQFLNNTPSARVAGLGSSAIANPENDLNFALYNPALLRPEMHGQFTTSGVDFVSDVLFADVAYAHHFDSVGTFFAQVMYGDYGEFERANEIGQRQGVFTASDFSFNLGYGYQLDSNWSFGGKLAVIGSQYDVYSSWGMAATAAVNYQIPQKRIVIALLAKNAGYQLDPFTNTRENLPFEMQLAFSNKFKYAPFRWQIAVNNLQRWELRYRDPNAITVNQFTGEVDDNFPSIWNNLLRHLDLGIEFSPSQALNVQFGYSFRRRQELNLTSRRTNAGFSGGIGFKIAKFRINYSFNFYHIADGANHITISTNFESFKKKPRSASSQN
jgi:hypothetical protein